MKMKMISIILVFALLCPGLSAVAVGTESGSMADSLYTPGSLQGIEIRAMNWNGNRRGWNRWLCSSAYWARKRKP